MVDAPMGTQVCTMGVVAAGETVGEIEAITEGLPEEAQMVSMLCSW